MHIRLLLFAVALVLSSAAVHADTFTTTITGNGLTAVFPNQGGPIYGNYYPRGNQIQTDTFVSVNGGALTGGELVFRLSSSPNYYDLELVIPLPPGQSLTGLELYGPDLVVPVYTGGVDFYSYPGTYNLADANGNPYTYVVTDDTLAAIPEPRSLTLCAIAALCLLAGCRRFSFASGGQVRMRPHP